VQVAWVEQLDAGWYASRCVEVGAAAEQGWQEAHDIVVSTSGYSLEESWEQGVHDLRFVWLIELGPICQEGWEESHARRLN
jgi:hypothetical protein